MINKAILIGNVGKDPEVKRFENNAKVSFSLATSETYTPKGGEKVTQTEWHNIVAWGKLAEIIEKYVKKGQSLYVEGKINYRSYDDRDGNKKYITEINASSIQMLGSKKTDDIAVRPEPQAEVQTETPAMGQPNTSDGSDDLPY